MGAGGQRSGSLVLQLKLGQKIGLELRKEGGGGYCG